MTKRTKIVATLSSLHYDRKFIAALLEAGVNVFRLNTAHQTPEEMGEMIDKLREYAPDAALLIDTKGPELRTSAHGDDLDVVAGQPLEVFGDIQGVSRGSVLYLTSNRFLETISEGSKVLIDDGALELIVTVKKADSVICTPQTDGVIKRRKSVNIPGIPIDLPALSERDMEFLRIAAKKNVRFIAHSFVRTREDIIRVQEFMRGEGSDARIIAKIENQQGIDNIDQILDHAYGIMVARGDLGIEIPGECVPPAQRMIVKKCIESKKPVIIATQMLHTMIENPRPTRAEISDVANAIYQRVDAIMLSGETANGKYPLEAVQTMARIAEEIEKHTPKDLDQKLHRVSNPLLETLARMTVRACESMPIRAIIADTLTGRTARYLAAFRGQIPIYAMCYKEYIKRELQLSYGVEPLELPLYPSRDEFITHAVQKLLQKGKITNDDVILVLAGSFGSTNGASFIEICQVKNILATAAK